LTSQDGSPILGEFQAVAWLLDRRPLDQMPLFNDFEPVVFAKHPQLGDILRKLKRLGASPARMTGSGSALFGVWPTAAKAKESARQFSGAVPVKFVRRAEYRERWKNALGAAAGYSTLFE
jgi:4-diphosphocytidyl-2-C-methyl-D-erythritol kinase